MHDVPHYLRFVRALAFVSVTLPVPAVLLASQVVGCGGQVASSDTGAGCGDQGCGISGGPDQTPCSSDLPCGTAVVPESDASGGGGGVRVAPDSGDAASPCADDMPCGVAVMPDSGDVDADVDAGGGPSRGVPELPASWMA